MNVKLCHTRKRCTYVRNLSTILQNVDKLLNKMGVSMNHTGIGHIRKNSCMEVIESSITH